MVESRGRFPAGLARKRGATARQFQGDSDSTTAIAGNLLSAQFGEAVIPPVWLEGLELRREIERLACDLHAAATGSLTAEDAWSAYPGW